MDFQIFYLGQTKELIFSTTPNTGILTASNIFAAFWASARATFCGVVTMTLPEIREILHSGQKCLTWVACLWSKMPMFQRAGVWEGEGTLPLAFQCLILMIWRPCEINLVMISSVASKCQDFEFGIPIFWQFHEMLIRVAPLSPSFIPSGK